jgi:hypothetical protein
MLKLRAWFRAPRTMRPVDAGFVSCPVQQCGVDVERCLTCSFRAGLVRDDDGALEAVVCTPMPSALISTNPY